MCFVVVLSISANVTRLVQSRTEVRQRGWRAGGRWLQNHSTWQWKQTTTAVVLPLSKMGASTEIVVNLGNWGMQSKSLLAYPNDGPPSAWSLPGHRRRRRTAPKMSSCDHRCLVMSPTSQRSRHQVSLFAVPNEKAFSSPAFSPAVTEWWVLLMSRSCKTTWKKIS